VYGKACEQISHDAPGKPVVTLSWVDANIIHCLITIRSVEVYQMFLLSRILIGIEEDDHSGDSKYGSAKTCVKQMVDAQTTLRLLVVPLRERIYMYGDNYSMVNSSIISHVNLYKRHKLWHCIVHEGILQYDKCFVLLFLLKAILLTLQASWLTHKCKFMVVNVNWESQRFKTGR